MSGWIDREKAIEDLQNGDPSQLYDLEDIKYWLNCLPSSAQPERKTGKWLRSGNCIFPYECDQCGDTNERATPFCPNCGADMKKKRVTIYKHNDFTGMISFNK